MLYKLHTTTEEACMKNVQVFKSYSLQLLFAAGAVTRKVVATEMKHLQILLSLTGKNGYTILHSQHRAIPFT